MFHCDNRNIEKKENGPVIEFNGFMMWTCAHKSMSHCLAFIAIHVISMIGRISELAWLIEHQLPCYGFLIMVYYIHVRHTSC